MQVELFRFSNQLVGAHPLVVGSSAPKRNPFVSFRCDRCSQWCFKVSQFKRYFLCAQVSWLIFFYLCTIESKIVDRFVLLLLLLLLFVSAVFVVVNYFNLFNNCGNPFCRVSLHVLFHFDGKLNSWWALQVQTESATTKTNSTTAAQAAKREKTTKLTTQLKATWKRAHTHSHSQWR